MKRWLAALGLDKVFRSFWTGAKDFLFGFVLYGMVREVASRKRHQEHVFMLLVVGDLMGIPVGSGYYRLRVLPYLLPKIGIWKKEVLRPKDLFNLTQE